MTWDLTTMWEICLTMFLTPQTFPPWVCTFFFLSTWCLVWVFIIKTYLMCFLWPLLLNWSRTRELTMKWDLQWREKSLSKEVRNFLTMFLTPQTLPPRVCTHFFLLTLCLVWVFIIKTYLMCFLWPVLLNWSQTRELTMKWDSQWREKSLTKEVRIFLEMFLTPQTLPPRVCTLFSCEATLWTVMSANNSSPTGNLIV